MMHRALIVLAALVIASASLAQASPGCPGGMLFRPTGGALVDAGWTGIAHEMPVLGYSLRMGLSCAASTPPCGSCPISGLIPNAGGNNLRCRNDTSISCTVATEVSDCGSAGTCHFFMSPPTPIGAGGVSSCYTSEVTGAVGGSVDVGTGAASIDVPLQASLFLGLTVDQGCPKCVGDPTPNDTVRGGSCSGGARDDLTCDANATSSVPDFGSTSFDCPPAPGTLTGTFVLGNVTFATGLQTATLSAASPTCNGAPGKRCLCATCSGGTNNGGTCNSNSACPGGSCTSNAGEPRKPNTCIDDTSTPGTDESLCADTAPSGDFEGECTGGPITTQCSVASGHPQRGCSTDADCCDDAGFCIIDPVTPGDCDFTLRVCYLDNGLIGGSVSVVGDATPPVGNTSDPTVLGGLACLGPSSGSAAVNAAAGLPGLGRTTQPGMLTFAEEVVVKSVAPGGTATTVGSPPASVVETTVTSPNAGEVTIIGTFNTGTAPTGYKFLGRLVQITAPNATQANPLRLTFDIAASEIPPGQSAASISIFRNNGGSISNCLGATQLTSNQPCITERLAQPNGDVRISVLTVAASDWTMAYSAASKCIGGKDKCVAKLDACKLGCHSKAEATGTVVDAACLDKCQQKYDGGTDPTKGCFARLEAKYGSACGTLGNSPDLSTSVDNFLDDVILTLDPGYPAPTLNKCSASKKKCAGKAASCKLGCYARSHAAGTAVDAACIGKCEDKFDGGLDPARGCFAKLEAKYGGGCLTLNDTGTVAALVDGFVGDVVCQTNGPSDNTCPCSVGTRVGPACWLLGATSESCTTVCSANSLVVDPATTTYAGSDGTDAQCIAVLDATGADPGNLPYVTTDCGVADECILAVSGTDMQRARCTHEPPDPDASSPFHRRACACTAP